MSYWDNCGKHQATYERLTSALVPATGAARTRDGELLRSLAGLHWDLFNNGGGNIAHAYQGEVAVLRKHRARIEAKAATLEDKEAVQTALDDIEWFASTPDLIDDDGGSDWEDAFEEAWDAHHAEEDERRESCMSTIDKLADAVILAVAEAHPRLAAEMTGPKKGPKK